MFYICAYVCIPFNVHPILYLIPELVMHYFSELIDFIVNT